VGTNGRTGYPIGPWLAFPMLGFIVGRLAASHREALGRRGRVAVLLISFAVPYALGSALMVARGSGLQRYGAMNFAYFLASIAVLTAGLAAVFAASRSTSLDDWVDRASISGLRSFALVPIQYLLIELVAAGTGVPSSPTGFLAAFAGVLILSFSGSALIARLVANLDGPLGRAAALAVAALLLGYYYGAVRSPTPGLAEIAIRSALQLSPCILLSYRNLATSGRARGESASGPALAGGTELRAEVG